MCATCASAAFAGVIHDGYGACEAKRIARQHSTYAAAFVYEWRSRSRCATTACYLPLEWGIYHGSELPFIFEPFANCSRDAEGATLSGAWGDLIVGLLESSSPRCLSPPSLPRGSTAGKGPGSASYLAAAPAGCVEWPAYVGARELRRMLLGNDDDRTRQLLSVVSDGASGWAGDAASNGASGAPYLASHCTFW